MKNLPLSALAQFLGISHPSQNLVTGFAIDSRKAQPGDLFFALPGAKVDGHQFLKEVSEKKAAGTVVKEDYRGEDYGLSLVRVPDVLEALQNLARASLAQRKAQVVAITGSLGKTTTKEFARQLLAPHYRIFASPLSYNSQITVPLSILMADKDSEILLLEMGMTHPGNLQTLISIAPPDIALLTTVAVQHAINFADGLFGISKEKSSIFSHAKTRVGILHHDLEHFENVKAVGKCSKKSFSLKNPSAPFYLEVKQNEIAVYENAVHVLTLPHFLPLKVHYHNFLAAAILARTLSISWEAIQRAAPSLKLPPMRFEAVQKKGILFINDAYNANPDSIKAALESLPEPESLQGKKIAVLSEMDALGSYSNEGHLSVGRAALKHVDFLFCVGPRCSSIVGLWEAQGKEAFLFQTKEELAHSLTKFVKKGDVVLLKGARSWGLDKILDFF